MNPLPLWIAFATTATAAPIAGWTQSYDAGYIDATGAYAGGSEIMHLVAHQGKLHAANGYWKDARWEDPPHAKRQSAQVLRLDAPDGRWQVDLDTGRANNRGLSFMKGNILKSVTFTRDRAGHPLPRPRKLLILAAGTNVAGQGSVSTWVRDDTKNTWTHSVVLEGSNANGIRWVPRDMEVHRDKVTGVERIFLLLGNPGIISGIHDPSAPGMIRWDRKPEFPDSTPFRTRPLGIVRANGSLLFSVGGSVYKRIDGANPAYTRVLDLGARTNTDTGGIRGLTTIANPNGPGESILFLWAPVGRSMSTIKRLDPDGRGGYTVHDEASMHGLMSRALAAKIGTTLGAHNMMTPVTHPATGETVHLIGFQGVIRDVPQLRSDPGPYYAGAMFAVRTSAQTYTVHEVNGRWSPGKRPLVCPRTFCPSPFGDGQLYVGGHDANGQRSDNMAWIFRAPVDVALRAPRADDVCQPLPNPPADKIRRD
jgi:hypothetical protein